MVTGRSRTRAKAFRLALCLDGAAHLARVDRVVEAQRSYEASLGMVGLEDLDVRGVVDALGGQGGDAVAVEDRAHRSCLGSRGAHFAPAKNR